MSRKRANGSADITLASVGVSNPRTVPSGALYVAAVLKQHGYRVDFRDYAIGCYRDLDPAALAASLDGAAGVVGLGCLSDTLPFVVAALADLKARDPEKTVILGGPGPTGVARELIETFPFIDIVAAGEGEATALDLMEHLAGGDGAGLEEVQGIAYRKGDQARVNPPRERLKDLDSLPFPLYDAVDVGNYPMINVVFSRGCPYRCTFCDVAPMWSRRNVRRSVESVIDEIEYLKTKYGRDRFEFTDETFILSQEKVMEFCEQLRRAKLDVKWSATGRVNLITRELLAEMARAGCEAMFFGIESGSDGVLEKVKKDFAVAEAVEALHTTLEYMKPVASFIWGFPFETEADLMQTLLLVVYLSQLGVDARLSRLAPFPMMPLYHEHGQHLTWFDEPGAHSGAEAFHIAGYPARVTDLIQTYPRIFPSFYWFQTENLGEKTRIVRSLARYWQASDWIEPAARETQA